MTCQAVIRIGDYGRLCKFKPMVDNEFCKLHSKNSWNYHYTLKTNYQGRLQVHKRRGKPSPWGGSVAAVGPRIPRNWFVVGKVDLLSE